MEKDKQTKKLLKRLLYRIEGLKRMSKRKVKRGNKKVAKQAQKFQLKEADIIIDYAREEIFGYRR